MAVVTMLLLDLGTSARRTRRGSTATSSTCTSRLLIGVTAWGDSSSQPVDAKGTSFGLRRLLLYATPDGKQLYERAGFEPNPNWMELPL